MKNEIIIKDSQIIGINRSKKENEADAIIYRDKKGKWHTIEFESCAKNYQNEKEKAGVCLKEQTKVVFYNYRDCWMNQNM